MLTPTTLKSVINCDTLYVCGLHNFKQALLTSSYYCWYYKCFLSNLQLSLRSDVVIIPRIYMRFITRLFVYVQKHSNFRIITKPSVYFGSSEEVFTLYIFSSSSTWIRTMFCDCCSLPVLSRFLLIVFGGGAAVFLFVAYLSSPTLQFDLLVFCPRNHSNAAVCFLKIVPHIFHAQVYSCGTTGPVRSLPWLFWVSLLHFWSWQ